MNTLFIFNDAPARKEAAFHGLRVANTLAKRGGAIRIFLFADGVHLANEQTGEFDVTELMTSLAQHEVRMGACANCLDKRGISVDDMSDTVARATLDDVSDWTEWAGKVLVY